MRFKSYITIEDAEAKVEVLYDHVKPFAGTRTEPRVVEAVEVTEVYLCNGGGRFDVCNLLPPAAMERLEGEAWDDLRARQALTAGELAARQMDHCPF